MLNLILLNCVISLGFGFGGFFLDAVQKCGMV